MNLSCETQYNQKAMTAMSKALRKTVRKKNQPLHPYPRLDRRGLFPVPVLLDAETGFFFLLTKRSLITLTIAAVLLVFLIWEDSINGYFARKKLAPGTETVKTVFKNSEFISSTKANTNTFTYSRINTIAETEDYFVFIYNVSHAQVYDKKHFSGKPLNEFRTFIEQATGKQIVSV